MQDKKLPKIINFHHKKVKIYPSKQSTGKSFIIHQKYDSFHSSIPQNNLAQIQQVIDLKPNKLNIISKKRSLSEFIANKKVSLSHIQQFNRKIFILNQKPVQELQTFKSLMNIQYPTKRIVLNSKLNSLNIYHERKTESLWDLQKNQTAQQVNQINQDFQVLPWNEDNSQKQNSQPQQ